MEDQAHTNAEKRAELLAQLTVSAAALDREKSRATEVEAALRAVNAELALVRTTTSSKYDNLEVR